MLGFRFLKDLRFGVKHLGVRVCIEVKGLGQGLMSLRSNWTLYWARLNY